MWNGLWHGHGHASFEPLPSALCFEGKRSKTHDDIMMARNRSRVSIDSTICQTKGEFYQRILMLHPCCVISLFCLVNKTMFGKLQITIIINITISLWLWGKQNKRSIRSESISESFSTEPPTMPIQCQQNVGKSLLHQRMNTSCADT